MIKQQKAIIISNDKVALNTYCMVIKCPTAALPVRPGQFMHIQVPNRRDLLLRRPISINSVDKTNSTMSLIIQSKGEGTKHLCKLPKDTELDIIGPVGMGFTMPTDAKKVAVIGGGIGVAPLRYLIERYKDVEFDAYVGFRDESCAYQIDEFKAVCNEYILTSDDGSIGIKGFATNILAQNIPSKNYDMIFACGPLPMVKALKRTLEPFDVPCQISLEERMGCGIGGCKVCVCKIKDGDGFEHKKVCQDGPVFNIEEVIV